MATSCETHCGEPECNVVCPDSQDAASCRALCKPANCTTTCQRQCESHCGLPRCGLTCNKPKSCPNPRCDMVCDTVPQSDIPIDVGRQVYGKQGQIEMSTGEASLGSVCPPGCEKGAPSDGEQVGECPEGCHLSGSLMQVTALDYDSA